MENIVCVRECVRACVCVACFASYLCVQLLLDLSYPDHILPQPFMDSKKRSEMAIHPTGLFARVYDMTCMRLVACMYVREEKSRFHKLTWPWKGPEETNWRGVFI